MATSDGIDFFARARLVSVAVLLLVGVVSVIGGVLDWATIDPCPEIVPGSTFDESELDDPLCPVRGIDTTEGKVVIVAGFVILAAAILLILRSKASFGWLALVSSIIAGSSAISAYRGIGDVDSSISRRFGLIDSYDPGVGLTVVAAAAVLGVIAAVVGIAATPSSGNAAGST